MRLMFVKSLFQRIVMGFASACISVGISCGCFFYYLGLNGL